MSTHNFKIANVKIDELIDNRIIRKLDETGYMDKVAAVYGIKQVDPRGRGRKLSKH